MDKRERTRIDRIEKVRRDKFNLVMIGTIILVTVIVICSTLLASASEETTENSDKYYLSVEIEQDDTLWDIAKRYNTDDTVSTKEYVNEIMYVNGLETDTIYAGQYIIVKCYK